MDRLVDPTLADLQAEYENAVSRNRKWESRRILVLGHVALIHVMAVHGGMRAMGFLRYSTREDRRTLIRTLGASAVIMIVGTLLLMVPFLKFVSRGRPDSAQLALYLIPQALPISIPVGLTCGILWGLGRVAASPRSRTLILLLATMASVASFTMLAWVVPAANQAFRVSMIGHPVLKGANELTLGELRELLEPGTAEPRPLAAPSDLRSLALNYYGRWALASAPLVLALFALALTHRRQLGRLVTLLAGCLAIFGYYVVMHSARRLGLDHTLSAFAAAWTPNVAFLILSVAVMLLASRRPNEPAHA
jgi:lipopolysaccharide export LptBFGC system permease protein LptF